MSKRKVTFEDGDGELDLEDDPPNKKVTLPQKLLNVTSPLLEIPC